MTKKKKQDKHERLYRTASFNVDVVHEDPEERDRIRKQVRDSIKLWS